jgi:hypothetical protein
MQVYSEVPYFQQFRFVEVTFLRSSKMPDAWKGDTWWVCGSGVPVSLKHLGGKIALKIVWNVLGKGASKPYHKIQGKLWVWVWRMKDAWGCVRGTWSVREGCVRGTWSVREGCVRGTWPVREGAWWERGRCVRGAWWERGRCVKVREVVTSLDSISHLTLLIQI